MKSLQDSIEYGLRKLGYDKIKDNQRKAVEANGVSVFPQTIHTVSFVLSGNFNRVIILVEVVVLSSLSLLEIKSIS